MLSLVLPSLAVGNDRQSNGVYIHGRRPTMLPSLLHPLPIAMVPLILQLLGLTALGVSLHLCSVSMATSTSLLKVRSMRWTAASLRVTHGLQHGLLSNHPFPNAVVFANQPHAPPGPPNGLPALAPACTHCRAIVCCAGTEGEARVQHDGLPAAKPVAQHTLHVGRNSAAGSAWCHEASDVEQPFIVGQSGRSQLSGACACRRIAEHMVIPAAIPCT